MSVQPQIWNPVWEIQDETISTPGETSTKNTMEMNKIKTEEPTTAVNVANQTQTSAANPREMKKFGKSVNIYLIKIPRYICLMIALAIIRSAFNYYTSYQENRFDTNPNLQNTYSILYTNSKW